MVAPESRVSPEEARAREPLEAEVVGVLLAATASARRLRGAEAAEVAQEIALLFLVERARLDRSEAWAGRAARHAALLRRAEQRRQPTEPLPPPESENEPAAPEPPLTPQERIDLERALARSAPRDGRLLLLDAQGYPPAEIAHRLALNPRSVPALLHRARTRLRRD